MQLLLISKDRPIERSDPIEELPAEGFAWLDTARSEPGEPWRDLAEKLTGVRIFDAHMADAANEAHPSFFDNTNGYEVIIFRGLVPHADPRDDDKSVRLGESKTYRYGPINTQPFRIKTAPVVFFVFPRLVVTVRAEEAPSIGQVRARLLSNAVRLPATPEDLVHRILNAMVDRYLDLRVPMAERVDRWQRNLLDPNRPFNDWHALLDQRIEIRKLEHLCEEQRDAIQEWRDHRYENLTDAMTVRINDLLEHIARVLNHAQRLEHTAESAVQLHFGATAHRTNEIMRTLTILTAIFMPLNLVTGVFGMNFKEMPWLDWHLGFWTTIGLMAVLAFSLMLFFRAKRYIERSDRPRRPFTSNDL